MEIFKLFGSVLVETSGAENALDKTGKKSEGLTTKIGNFIKTAAKWAVGIATSVVAAGATVFKLASDTAQAADTIDKMSQKLGMSRKSFQEWDYVLSQNGMSIESMESGIEKLSFGIADALEGSENAATAFSKVGLSLEEISSMSREEVFDAVIAGLQGMEDNATRAALADELLGGAAMDLTPLLNQTADATQALKDKANDMGMVMGDKAVNAGVAFTDAMDTLKRSADGVKNTLGASLLPIITKGVDYVQEKLPVVVTTVESVSMKVQTLNQWVKEHETLMTMIAIVLATAAAAVAIYNISLSAGAIATAVMTAATTAFGAVMAFVTSPITLVVVAIGALIAIIVLCVKHWDTISATVQRVAEDVVAWISTVPGRIAEWATQMYQTAVAWLQQFATGIYEGFLELVGKIGDWVEENIITPIKDKATAAKAAGKKIIDDLLSGLKSAWTNVVNWFNGVWDSLFNRSVTVSADNNGNVTVGGYASGLSYVPYDNFPAFLHKGEAVLTAAQAQAWRSGYLEQRPVNKIYLTQYIQSVPKTPVELAAATEAYFELARWS